MIKSIRMYRRYLRLFGIQGLALIIIAKITKKENLFKISRTDIKFPFFLRFPSSDFIIYEQIFIKRDYDFKVRKLPKTIVDAGANIGLASIYFANKFPEAKIIAIEPEASNFELLKKNIFPYKNIIPVCGALWDENKYIDVVDVGLDKCGFMTKRKGEADKIACSICHEIKGMTVDKIMENYGIEYIDILKIDIEGAEREVFQDPSSWIEKIDTLIVELHERLKVGSSRSFYNSTSGFDDEWFRRENVYLTRSNGCLTRSLP